MVGRGRRRDYRWRVLERTARVPRATAEQRKIRRLESELDAIRKQVEAISTQFGKDRSEAESGD